MGIPAKQVRRLRLPRCDDRPTGPKPLRAGWQVICSMLESSSKRMVCQPEVNLRFRAWLCPAWLHCAMVSAH